MVFNSIQVERKVEILVQGHLDKSWEECFEGMSISRVDKNTLLTGIIRDEAHLHGILSQIRDINLRLVSVHTDII